MIFLDRDKLEQYWDSIAKGFQKSPLEAVLSLIALVLLIAVPIVLFLIKQKKEKVKKIEQARSVFETLCHRKGLLEAEKSIIEAMKDFTPRGVLDLPSLTTDVHLFNASLRRMMRQEPVSDSRLASLRLKLGMLQSGTRTVLHSTVELEAGMTVEIVMGDKRIGGIVDSVSANSFALRSPVRLPSGRRVEIRIKRPSGLYSINSVVLEDKKGILFLKHSERVKRIQKRRFFRKAARYPVLLQGGDSWGDTEGKGVRTRLIDLGAGGARIKNPGLDLRTGQILLLKIQIAEDETIEVKAVVHRVSSAAFSVVFNEIKESVRDRITKMVLH